MSRRHAWVAAGLYIVVVAAGLFAELGARQGLIVSRDAAETARRLLSSEALYRAGVGADLLMTACDVVLTAILYVVLRGYGRTTALAATALRLVSDAMLGVKTFVAVAPLMILKSANLADAFGRTGAEALALLFLRLHGGLYGAVMVFAGLNLGAMGLLVLRGRGWTSRVTGALLALACLCDLAAYGGAIVAPALADALPDALTAVPLLSEIVFIVWLLVSRPEPDRTEPRTNRS